MSWDVNLITMLRVLINDLNAPQKNTDNYLKQVVITSAIMVDSEIKFANNYTYDLSAITITPDPITQQDLIFQALVPLKSACIMNQADFRLALSQGIKVKDGDSFVDTSVGFRGYRDILQFGPCSVYDRLKWDIQSGRANGQTAEFVGGVVMSPYRPANVESNISDVRSFFDRFSHFLSGNQNTRFCRR